MKEYNIQRNCTIKHSNTCEQVRKGKFENLKKRGKAQQSVFVNSSKDTISNVKLSFKIDEAIAKGCTSFRNHKFIKVHRNNCRRNLLRKKNSLENMSLLPRNHKNE